MLLILEEVLVTYEVEIEELRKIADRLDEEIFEKITKRVEAAVRISVIKRRHGQFDVDACLEEFYDQIKELAMRTCLDAEGVKRIFREIMNLYIEAEREARNEDCF